MIKVIQINQHPADRLRGAGSRSAHRIAKIGRFAPVQLGRRVQKKRGKKLKCNRKWSALPLASSTSASQRREATAFWRQIALAVSDHHGTTVVWHGWHYCANELTYTAIARGVLYYVGRINVKRGRQGNRDYEAAADLWDGRISRPERIEDAWAALRLAYESSISAVDRLGSLVWEDPSNMSED